jgi:hypothetical protein
MDQFSREGTNKIFTHKNINLRSNKGIQDFERHIREMNDKESGRSIIVNKVTNFVNDVKNLPNPIHLKETKQANKLEILNNGGQCWSEQIMPGMIRFRDKQKNELEMSLKPEIYKKKYEEAKKNLKRFQRMLEMTSSYKTLHEEVKVLRENKVFTEKRMELQRKQYEEGKTEENVYFNLTEEETIKLNDTNRDLYKLEKTYKPIEDKIKRLKLLTEYYKIYHLRTKEFIEEELSITDKIIKSLKNRLLSQ